MKFAYLETTPNWKDRSPEEVLFSLDRPTLIRIKGKDSSKAVLVSALLHGNEPAGFRAMVAEINSHPSYTHDVFFFIGNVKAAQLSPVFTHRLVPGGSNYNRIWTEQAQTEDELLAQEVLNLLKSFPLIAHLDLHSFTAIESKPHAFCVNESKFKLAKNLVEDIFLMDIPLNALIEKTQLFGPCCVVECGINNSPEADAYASETLHKFLCALGTKSGLIKPLLSQVFVEGVNFKLKPDVSVSFSAARETAKLTLREDLSSLNRKEIPAGEFLGWTDSVKVFTARNKIGNVHPGQWLEVKNGKLFTTQTIVPQLLTAHEERMKESGFYFFKRLEASNKV